VQIMLDFNRLSACIVAAAAIALPVAAYAANPGFDVEAATRAYTSMLQGPARERSDAYFEGGYWLPLWGALISIALDLVILNLGLSARFRSWGERISRRPWIVTGVTALCYSALGTIVTLPWALYTGFFREKQYGLMNLDLGGWFAQFAIGFALSMVMGTLLIVLIYAVIRRFPKRWWLLATGVVGLFATLGMLIAPVYIAPLFNTYTELPEGPVRDRIVGMAKANDVPAEHIYLFDASKQSDRISANVSGVGPTIRISLNDNLLNRSSEPEIAAVMGHELGHYVLGHVWRNLIFVTALAALALFLISRIVPALIARYGARWGVRDVGDPASMPVFSLCLAVFGLLATPAMNTLIRVDESEADAFGLNAAREPDGFASAAMKLSEYRKIEPGPVEEALFFDHPSGRTRVRMAMQWKKDNMPDAQIVVPEHLKAQFKKD
jgi:STE24 endopeptidase